jgi:anaerobic ribonucleoside-triphosphate reductase activating protein
MRLRMHALLERSRANGPGQRAVVWCQSCTLGCPGCFNAATHDPHSGTLVDVMTLAGQLVAISGIEGVTISGGEPLQQSRAVLALLRQIRAASSLSVVMFTGYTWDEISRMPLVADLPQLVDVLIAGRYDASQRVAAGLIGSSNKTLHCFSNRYTQADFAQVPPAEVRIGADGTLTMSGINPLTLGGLA